MRRRPYNRRMWGIPEFDERGLVLFVSGGALGNPGQGAIAYTVYRPAKCGPKPLASEVQRVPRTTDNLAAVSAAVAGLRKCRELSAKTVYFHTDNHVLRRLLQDESVVRNSALVPLLGEYKKLAKSFFLVVTSPLPAEYESVPKPEAMVSRELESIERKRVATGSPATPGCTPHSAANTGSVLPSRIKELSAD